MMKIKSVDTYPSYGARADHGPNRNRVNHTAMGARMTRTQLSTRIQTPVLDASQFTRAIDVQLALWPSFQNNPRQTILHGISLR